MGATSVVEAARKALGPVGTCLPVNFTSTPSADALRDAARQLEQAGFHAVWTNEVIGKDAFTQLSLLLAATERLAVGTCVANIWARPAQTAHAAAATLAQAYPNRFALGLGVGYPQQADSVGREYGKPLATMREYVTAMDGETWPPAPEGGYPRLLGANGPKMLALAREIADGALPAGLPPEYTARARELLGPDKLLVVGVSVALDADPDQARASARQTAAIWAGRESFKTTLVDLGYAADEVEAMSDELLSRLIAHGSPDAVAAQVRAHLAAGADHVTLLEPIGTEFATGIDQLVKVAPAFADLR